ncbi:methyl-accepting chemotaxis protein [Niveibacterium terrae]|uniref:methyl-accepting chemotaxis protein n=1 Tax=Niveibacterium terrae TaxID=3373598 RepID=UPI003A928D97
MKPFRNATIRARLALMSSLALLLLALLSAYSLFNLRSNLLEDRRVKTRNLVEVAIGSIDYFVALQRSGRLSEAQAQAGAIAALRATRYAGKDYFFIISSAHTYVLQPSRPEAEGSSVAGLRDAKGKLFAMEMDSAARSGGGFVDYLFPRPGSQEPVPKLSYVARSEPWGWVVGTGIYIDDVDAAFRSQALLLGGIAAFAILLLGFVSWRIGGEVVRQVGGEPSQAIMTMQQVAAGDLTVSLKSAPSGSMLAALGEMIGALRQMMGKLGSDASMLSVNARQIADDSGKVSLAAQEQVDATSTMAAAMEELTVSISHISDSAALTGEEARRAASLSGDGTTQVEAASAAIQAIAAAVSRATGRIQDLDARAREISNIAAVIREIAGQTNLLALNAAIEAARAGEQGRGFAVVADEVRKLAERTANATVEIEQMISSVQTETHAVVGVMASALPLVEQGEAVARAAASTLAQISDGAQQTLEHIGEVADATREQSSASTSIAQRVESVAQMVEETSSAMRSTAHTANEVDRVARHLDELVKDFKY